MARTVITWNPVPSKEIIQEFINTGFQWAAENRATGYVNTDPFPAPDTGVVVATREFPTVADAQAWMDEVILPRATPVSYQVLDN